ncbi:LamG domain-containing protein [Planctomycetota bacterium]
MYRKLIYLVSFVLVLSVALTNVAQAADPDLVGWWRLDDGSGMTAADFSGNGNDGTLQGNPRWVAGQVGGALQFNGVDEFVDVPHAEILTADNEVTVMAWINTERHGGPGAENWQGIIAKGNSIRSYSLYTYSTGSGLHFSTTSGGAYIGTTSSTQVPLNEWVHVCAMVIGGEHQYYINGEDAGTGGSGIQLPGTEDMDNVVIGRTQEGAGRSFLGMIDDPRIYMRGLTQEEVQLAMSGEGVPQAFGPDPANGAIHPDTWVTISWKKGDYAVTHDVYLGDNFDDVNDGIGDTFRGNQGDLFYIAGFPGFAYPDGLVNGTTYYWRIDEVNDLHPDSPWRGDVWSFTVPPKTAYNPNPAASAEFVDQSVKLTWTAGFGAKLHYIVLGEDFDEVSNAATGIPNGTTTYNPGPLKLAKTYYWRVDEFDGLATHKGDVWSFTTLGAVSGPNPSDGAVGIKPSVVLNWDAGAVAASHVVYFGTDPDAVKNATTTSPEYKGPKALGEESYDPGELTLNTTYHWRIDEVNGVNPDSPWAGNVWSFTTGDFLVIDDFEDYDAGDNQIWFAWHDGLGAGTQGTPGYIAGNGTGAAVGDENTASYTEETIVQGGLQSMPLSYDNNKQGFSKYSETELTLTAPRDWTQEGVSELSLWFRGNPPSVGSFVEGPAGTYTMTASGADIWAVNSVEADEFHYAFKTLSGVGSIVARVESVENTDGWAKAGVMIRQTLDPDSAHAMMVVTPSSGVSFQRRPGTGSTSVDDTTAGITAPYWVKIERDLAGNFSAYSSANGTTWQKLGVAEPIQMGTNVYIGLAVTAHNVAATCEAVFSNVTTTGSVSAQWTNQDVGIASNDAEPLYVAVSNSAGAPAVVVHDDPAAANIDTWTEWIIPLQAFADQGIVLTNVDRIAIGLGTQGNMTVPGGSGKMLFDNFRLYLPREAAE